MTPKDFERELRFCGRREAALDLFREAKNILTDAEYVELVDAVAGGYVFQAFVRNIAQGLKEKMR